jgi:hypothetical protein
LKTPFLGQAYALRSLPLSAQSLINLYSEYNESKEGEQGAFYGTPGLQVKALLPGGQGRALQVSGDGSFLYAVSGAAVYKLDTGFSKTLVGTLPSSVGRVSACANATQVVFAHDLGWHYTTGTGLTSIPAGPKNSIVTYMDGYGVFTESVDGEFGLTSIDDFSTISALDIATAEALPDNLVSVYADQREVWLFGDLSTEIWADTGAESFPFERIPGGVLSVGCAAPFSVAYTDGSVFWLAKDRTGKAMVLRTVGYQTSRVSTHAIEHAIDGYAVIDDAYAFGYVQEGHIFYVLTFPTADITWVYDCSTKQWGRRGWRDSNGVLHRHRVGAYAFFNGYHCILDHDNGTLYTMDLDFTTDAGSVIYRERAWPLMPPEDMRRMRCDMLEIVAEQGVGNITGADTNPAVALQMSYDGGVSFGNERYQYGGAMGNRIARMRWRRNGLGRRPVAKVSTTSTCKVVWMAANVDGEVMLE